MPITNQISHENAFCPLCLKEEKIASLFMFEGKKNNFFLLGRSYIETKACRQPISLYMYLKYRIPSGNLTNH